MLKKAIVYIRVSTLNQKENLKLQEETCKEYCQHNNIEVVKVFSDTVSGVNKDRPGIIDAINFCKENEIEILVSTGPTVISRIFEDYNYFSEQLNKSNTKILLIENTRNEKDY